jgi:hypothetical protein
MLFSVNSDISLPCETLLFTVVEGASELGLYLTGHVYNIVRAKEMVKKGAYKHPFHYWYVDQV